MRSLTLAIRLPLLVALAVFLSSVGTTHLAVHVMQREMGREVEQLADVYIDSLSGVVLPPLRNGDISSLQAMLERGMGFQRGITDLAIVVADRQGRPLAQVGEPRGPSPLEQGLVGDHWALQEDGDIAWIQRQLVEDGETIGLMAAQLAFPEQSARRQRLVLALTVVDLILTGMAALLAAAFSRRLIRPFMVLTAALRRAGSGQFEPLDIGNSVWRRDVEAAQLAQAYNSMTMRLREREELSGRLAEKERAAVLGRLAASLAHEVRNPLAGMLTALDTIRLFGAEPEAREQAVGLVERGLRQIEGVVKTTLATHRQDDEGRPITREDLEDLKLLVLPEARRGGIKLGWTVELAEPFPVDALRLRQLLLNLLLNAVAATPPGRRVSLYVTRRGRIMVAEVADEAGGLPPTAARMLSGIASDGGVEGRLGLEIASQLTTALGAQIEVVPEQGGSRILVRVPAREEHPA